MSTTASGLAAAFMASLPDEEAMTRALSIAEGAGVALPVLLDQFSLEVASRYQGGSLAYELAGQAMDAVYTAMLTSAFLAEHQIPKITLEVYEAFDIGEYHHPGDQADEDPVEKHTKAEIARLLGMYAHGA